jgi:hypothetical protein
MGTTKIPNSPSAEAVSPLLTIDPTMAVELMLQEAELMQIQAEIACPLVSRPDEGALRDISPFGR